MASLSNLVKAGEVGVEEGSGQSWARLQAEAGGVRAAWEAEEGVSPGLEVTCSLSPPRCWRLERKEEIKMKDSQQAERMRPKRQDRKR